MRLIEIQPGKWVRIGYFDGGRKMENRLLQHGLYPGDQIRVLRVAPLHGPLLIEVNGREVAIGRGVAEKIIVETEE